MDIIFDKILHILKQDSSTLLDFEPIILTDLKLPKELIFDKMKPYLGQTSVSNYEELRDLIDNMSGDDSGVDAGGMFAPVINLFNCHREGIGEIVSFLCECTTQEEFLSRVRIIIESTKHQHDYADTLEFLFNARQLSLEKIMELLQCVQGKLALWVH